MTLDDVLDLVEAPPAPEPPPAEPLAISASDAARLIGVTTNVIYDWTRAELIPHHRIGNKILFGPDELREWWRSTLTSPREPSAAERLGLTRKSRIPRGDRRTA